VLQVREGIAPALIAPAGSAERGRVGTLDTEVRGREGAVAQGRARDALARPLWIVAVCSLVALLRFAHAALVPLALALLVAFVLSGVVEALRRRGVPRGLSASVLLLMAALALGGVVELTWAPAQQWVQSAPRIFRTIDHKVRPAQSVVRRLDYIARRAAALANSDGDSAPGTPAAPAAAAADLTPLEVFAATGWVVGAILTVMAFALLLLIAGPPTLARMTVALAADLHAVHVLQIIDAIRREVGRYYGTLVLINLGFGTVVAGAMWLLGMPNPALWGVMAGVLNFIPFLGAATTFAVVTLVALVTFDGIGHVLLVAGSYLLLAGVEGHVVEPIFLGRRLKLNPVVVLTALWLGGWLWGIPGVLLALPAVVAVKIARGSSREAKAAQVLP
jgi:predicted PurR-regulated permease PerM